MKSSAYATVSWYFSTTILVPEMALVKSPSCCIPDDTKNGDVIWEDEEVVEADAVRVRDQELELPYPTLPCSTLLYTTVFCSTIFCSIPQSAKVLLSTPLYLYGIT